jgi:hypothetical protein
MQAPEIALDKSYTDKQTKPKKKMPAILGSGYQCLLDSAVFVLICIVAHITSRTPLYASVQVFFFSFSALCSPYTPREPNSSLSSSLPLLPFAQHNQT